MKKGIFGGFIIIAIVLSCFFSALAAASTSVDAASVYKQAKNYAELGAYEEALTKFEQISRYKDSRSWQDYCKAMIDISQANGLEEEGYLSDAKDKIMSAMSFFRPLANMSFEDSEKLYEYCSVRIAELGMLTQQAIDGYSKLYDVMDSADRYRRLINHVLLPTQAPSRKQLPSMLKTYAFRADRSVTPFQGPGSGYETFSNLRIDPNTDVGVCAVERGKYSTYYMAETKTNRGKIRFWVMDLRLIPLNEGQNDRLPEICKNPRNTFLSEAAEALLGPGESYCKANVIIPKGMKVTAFEAEDAYTMIECASGKKDKLMRVWVRTDCLAR